VNNISQIKMSQRSHIWYIK